LATALAPADISKLLTQADYAGWLDRNQSALVEFSALYTPEGNLDNIAVIQVVGDKKLGETIIRTLSRRRVKPAIGADGVAAYARVHSAQRMLLPDTAAGKLVRGFGQAPDLEIALPGLPASANGLTLKLVLAVGPDGKVTSCQPAAQETRQNVAAKLCTQRDKLEQPVAKNAQDSAVAYVTDITAALKPEAPQ